MKSLVYLFVFILILGGVSFAFFSMATPNVPQTVVTKTIDPKDAFQSAQPSITAPLPTTSAAQAPVAEPTPASTTAE